MKKQIWLRPDQIELVLENPMPNSPIEQAIEALWVVSEHNALHHGDTHNTTLQCRAALAALRSIPGRATQAEFAAIENAETTIYSYGAYLAGFRAAEDRIYGREE